MCPFRGHRKPLDEMVKVISLQHIPETQRGNRLRLLPCLKITEETLVSIQVVPQERISEHDVEEIIDVAESRAMEVLKLTSTGLGAESYFWDVPLSQYSGEEKLKGKFEAGDKEKFVQDVSGWVGRESLGREKMSLKPNRRSCESSAWWRASPWLCGDRSTPRRAHSKR